METPAKLYQNVLDARQTEDAIALIHDFFPGKLAAVLNLRRVTAPLIVPSGMGINDDLNGVEQPVRFSAKSLGNREVEVVQSLAKWKRITLARLKVEPGKGIYTNMNALRPDETLDATHSIYVDQWDWEKCIADAQRNLEYFRRTVEQIYSAMKDLESHIFEHFPQLAPVLPDKIHFIHTSELEARFPNLSHRQREYESCRELGAVCIEGIGYPLSNGHPADGRAPDYDDWSTLRGDGKRGLNGDILVWHPTLQNSLELSSMGIRVNSEALKLQLAMQDCDNRRGLWYHRQLLEDKLPQSIGGGIGQSRLCMFLLRKSHIRDVQASVWPDDCCASNNAMM